MRASAPEKRLEIAYHAVQRFRVVSQYAVKPSQNVTGCLCHALLTGGISGKQRRLTIGDKPLLRRATRQRDHWRAGQSLEIDRYCRIRTDRCITINGNHSLHPPRGPWIQLKASDFSHSNTVEQDR